MKQTNYWGGHNGPLPALIVPPAPRPALSTCGMPQPTALSLSCQQVMAEACWLDVTDQWWCDVISRVPMSYTHGFHMGVGVGGDQVTHELPVTGPNRHSWLDPVHGVAAAECIFLHMSWGPISRCHWCLCRVDYVAPPERFSLPPLTSIHSFGEMAKLMTAPEWPCSSAMRHVHWNRRYSALWLMRWDCPSCYILSIIPCSSLSLYAVTCFIVSVVMHFHL